MSVKQLKDYPTDRSASQVRLYLMDKYGLGGDSRSEFLYCEFARKYLIYKKEDSTVFYNSMGEPSKQYFNLSESDLDRIPCHLNQLFKTANEMSKRRLIFLYGIGLVFFKPLFNKNSKIQNIWQKLNRISSERTIKFTESLFSLPFNLQIIYARTCSTSFQSAYRYHTLMEEIFKETILNEEFTDCDMPFTYSDYIKDVRDEDYEIPYGKISWRLHNEFMEKLEEYYTELHNALPSIKQQEQPLPPDCQLMLKRTNNKTPIPVFWARYLKDLFQEAYGKPYLKYVATFINELFDTKYTEYDIANITRKNM